MKKITLSLFALALLGVGCTTDVTESVAPTTIDNVVGFMSSTTRASIATLTTIQDDGNGIVIYGTSGDSPSGWYTDVDGTNNYIYSSDVWGWKGNDVPWPSETTGYPMKFYAIYASDYTNVSTSDTDITALSMEYTAGSDSQIDLLTASTSADARPSGDKLPLVFNHSLTKISFSITSGDGIDAYIQATGVNGVSNKCTVALTEDDEWETTEEEGNSSGEYSYLDTTLAESPTSGSITGTNGDLMLIPQTSTNWVPMGTTLEDGYIYILYRLASSDNANIVGYTNAANHPMFDEDANSDLNNEPLFVKVGYPLSSDDEFTWEAGLAYTYDINLGTTGATNGYLLDTRYYDEEGNPTDLLIETTDLYDPLTDGYIDFIISVNIWDDTAGSSTID